MTTPKGDALTEIRNTYQAHMPAMERSSSSFPWADKEMYARWLAQTHAYVAHTTRLTALAAARLPPQANELHSHMLAHAAEEAGHDQLLLDDLRALGRSIDEFRPLPVTDAFWQAVYFQIDHLTPWAIFGRVIPLEGMAAYLGAACVKAVESAHGRGTATFLGAHADADPGHLERAFGVVARVTPEEGRVICDGMRMTFALYQLILDGILRG